jgi:hypothetical protein
LGYGGLSRPRSARDSDNEGRPFRHVLIIPFPESCQSFYSVVN